MVIIASAHRLTSEVATIRDIYIDESSQTKNKFLVIGGISLPKADVDAANECIGKARLPQLPHGELKWGKVSNNKIPAYGRTVKSFFDEAEFRDAHFHCLVVNTHNFNHHKHNEGSREIGFNKEIYQLCMKFARIYKDKMFHVYPDYRDTNQRPEDLRLILNRGRVKKGDKRDWPFRRCHFRDSSATPLLQLVDLLTGSVAWCVNGHANAAGASTSKTTLSKYVLSRAGVTDCSQDTAVTGKFTIWHRQLQ